MRQCLCVLTVLFLPAVVRAADRPDILIADFEGDTYGEGWKITGTAFGKGPAHGTLPNQMPVSGFLGKGLVNSYLGGDDSTGTLTSPAFKIERKHINFLVGGGKHPGQTCVNLLVGGKIVRTATGPNDRSGGSEHLDWHTWNVAEFEGQSAVIQIVDDRKGGWGHINADHIVQSDGKKQAERVARTFDVNKRYLHLPVKTGVTMRRVKLVVGTDVVREFDIELADGVEPDFWAFADVSAFKGKPLTVESQLASGARGLATLTLADEVPAAEKLYREKHRPLFHFTSRRGWLNDPNGLVHADGEWHLFYQHNPFGINWGNMHWGHAVSTDLFRWQELGEALYPRKYGDWAFSGSAVVDSSNTSGWGTKEKPPLVLAYTSTGRGECIAYSTDRGRTWTEYDRNPVVKHSGRDPKLVWYEKGKHWVMAVYDEFEGKQWIAFHTSPDLKTWTFASRIGGFFECPDLFEMSTPGDPQKRKWVLYAADGKYLLGTFDGKTFHPDFKEKKQLWYGQFYAAQTFDNTPRDPQGRPRRIQIGWANGVTFPGMPFNQQMTLPVELTLSQEPAGLKLKARPVEEVWKLRDEVSAVDRPARDAAVKQPQVLADNLDAFVVSLTMNDKPKDGFTLDLRGTKLVYDAAKDTLTCKNVTCPLGRWRGSLSLRVFVDRGSVEVFADDGAVVMSVAAIPDEKNRKVVLDPRGGEVKLVGASVYRMKSAWEK